MSPQLTLRFLRRLVVALLLTAGLSPVAISADAPKPAEKPPAPAATEAPPAPVAVPLAELATQAETAVGTVRDIETTLASEDLSKTIGAELPALTREIDARMRESSKILAQKPPLEVLRTSERSWQNIRAPLSNWIRELTQRITTLDKIIARLDALAKTWTETQRNAAASNTPPEVMRRIDSIIAAVTHAQGAAAKQRAQMLTLQTRVAAQDARINDGLGMIRAARGQMVEHLFDRDSAPLWSPELDSQSPAELWHDAQQSLSAQAVTLQGYVNRQSEHFALHAVLFVLIALALFWVRERVREWVKRDPGLRHVEQVFALPLAATFVLAIFCSRWLYPQAPRLVWAALGAGAMIPTVLILRRLISSALLPVLYAIVVFYFMDQLRAVVAAVQFVPRALFLIETLGGAVFLVWLLSSLRPQPDQVAEDRRIRRWARIAAVLAFVFLVGTALANALGYVTLANLTGNAAFGSAYFGVLLYALVTILDALIAMLLRVRPFSSLGMVRSHRELLRVRIRWVLSFLAFIWWAYTLLDRLSIREQIFSGVGRLVTNEFSVGSISISLVDVAAFVVVVWASFWVSRFVRFLLEEDVYPRAHLSRGVPYAISKTLHYIILLAGFFVAVAALGVDMTKFTILASAFTVGVGFGLQNIFNNFVSGLILLFERPVQVGDVVQMNDASGIVERIGIRASVVRTTSGSEIIVPNGKLISETVVNWTFSSSQRGVQIPVAVAHGANPERVLQILEQVADAHARVCKTPAPQSLLLRVGPDWLGFELRVWTDAIEKWVQVQSELSLAITSALTRENIALK